MATLAATAAAFLTALRAYAGTPYVWGGKTAAGLDCSGLITLALADVGVPFVHGSAQQIDACEPITVDQAWATPGALLYRPGHDAISLGDGRAIEAIRPHVQITPRTDTYQGQPRFTRAGFIPGVNYNGGSAVAVPRMASPARGRATSPYGPRKPIPGVTSATFHAGQDIANDTGTPIYAAFAGTVRKAGWGIVPYRSGNGILIANPDGEGQYYGHLSKIRVKVGQRVARGERIGDMGATGNVTGPHLHFETWAKATDYRSHYNPLVLFKKYGVRLGSGPLTPNPPKTPPATEKDWSDMVSENEMQKLLEANNERLISDLLRTKQPIYGSLKNYTNNDEMSVASFLRYAATAMPDGRNFYDRLATRLAAIEANQRGITAAQVAAELAPQLLDGLEDLITDAIDAVPDRDAEQIAKTVVAQLGARLTQED